MKKFKKALVLFLCAVLLVAGSVMGTLAYLTSQDTVVNTFTVGDIAIILDEANVDEMGNVIDETRVKTNDYHLLPGHSYVKDPTVTIRNDSEPAYVRMMVTVNNVKALKAAMPEYVAGDDVFMLQYLIEGWDSTMWQYVACVETANGEATVATYEFRYRDIVSPAVPGTDKAYVEANEMLPLFTAINMPGAALTNEKIANLDGVIITVDAHAIQADGFADADAAWDAFNAA